MGRPGKAKLAQRKRRAEEEVAGQHAKRLREMLEDKVGTPDDEELNELIEILASAETQVLEVLTDDELRTLARSLEGGDTAPEYRTFNEHRPAARIFRELHGSFATPEQPEASSPPPFLAQDRPVRRLSKSVAAIVSANHTPVQSAFVVSADARFTYLATCAHGFLLMISEGCHPITDGVMIAFKTAHTNEYREVHSTLCYFSFPDVGFYKQYPSAPRKLPTSADHVHVERREGREALDLVLLCVPTSELGESELEPIKFTTARQSNTVRRTPSCT